MRPKTTTLTILFLLLCLPTTSAETGIVNVPSTFNEIEGYTVWTNKSSDQYRNLSFQFQPAFYDTVEPFSNDSISRFNLKVTYDLEVSGLGNKVAQQFTEQHRLFQTKLLVNGTDYINFTTTIDRPQCFLGLCSPTVRVCHTMTYAAPTLATPNSYSISTSNQSCYDSDVGWNPPDVTHDIVVNSIQTDHINNVTGLFSGLYGIGPYFSLISATSDHRSTTHTSNYTNPLVNQTNYTKSLTLSTNAITQDYKEMRMDYTFFTWNTAARDIQIAHNTTTLGPDAFQTILTSIFNGAKSGLNFIFALLPAGGNISSIIDFLATALTLLIGFPLFAIFIFTSNPAKFLLYHTVFLLAVGTIRYASGTQTDLRVIWETGFNLYKQLARIIGLFVVWLYQRIIELAKLIASNNVILITVVAIAVGAAVFTFLKTLGG